jgi:hypothetical protein
MTIWLLALLLLASLAGLGYRQGAVRVAFSLVAILVGALLAAPLGGLLRPVFGIFGVKNPVLTWMLGPLIVFILISIAFKVAAFPVHQKVDVFYKYKVGELRLVLWERLSRRLGLCLGLLNATLYLILLSFVIYNISYWTIQIATEGSDSTTMNLINRLGRDLQSSGFIKMARAADPMADSYYQAADLAGELYNNPLLEARLARYPAFLGLAETPEFQDIGNDNQFTEMRQRREPIKNLLDYPKTQGLLNNPDLLRTIWATVKPNLTDLPTYLATGRSAKYSSEPILGRWDFDINAALGSYLRAHQNIASSEMQKIKRWFVMGFSKTTLTVKTDHQLTLRNAPQLQSPAANGVPTPSSQTLQGQWKSGDGKYQLSFAGAPELSASVDEDRMTVTGDNLTFVFSRED